MDKTKSKLTALASLLALPLFVAAAETTLWFPWSASSSTSTASGAAARQALAGHRTQFVLGDIEPAAMLGRVAELQTAHARTGLVRRKSFVCSSCRRPE